MNKCYLFLCLRQYRFVLENRDESSPSPTDHQHNLSNKAKKQRKARTAFSDHQLNSLEKSFERQKYLSVQDRMELAAKLNLSDTQVKTWYQNRRYYFKIKSWETFSIV